MQLVKLIQDFSLHSLSTFQIFIKYVSQLEIQIQCEGYLFSGVVSHYFEPRWNLFIEYLNQVIQYNSTYNESFVQQAMFNNVEKPFTFDTTSFPTTPTGKVYIQ